MLRTPLILTGLSDPLYCNYSCDKVRVRVVKDGAAMRALSVRFPLGYNWIQNSVHTAVGDSRNPDAEQLRVSSGERGTIETENDQFSTGTGCKIGRPAFGLFGTFSQLCTGTSHITYYRAHLLTQQLTSGIVTFASRLNRPWWVCWRSHFPSNCNLKIYSFIWITNIDISSRRLSSELLLLRY